MHDTEKSKGRRTTLDSYTTKVQFLQLDVHVCIGDYKYEFTTFYVTRMYTYTAVCIIFKFIPSMCSQDLLTLIYLKDVHKMLLFCLYPCISI